MEQYIRTLVAHLRPSTLAGLIYDIGWAVEEEGLSKSQYLALVKVALDTLVQHGGVEEARELIRLEGELPQAFGREGLTND